MRWKPQGWIPRGGNNGVDIISNQLSTNYVFLLINKISILKKIQHLLHSSTKKTPALHEAKWLPCYFLIGYVITSCTWYCSGTVEMRSVVVKGRMDTACRMVAVRLWSLILLRDVWRCVTPRLSFAMSAIGIHWQIFMVVTAWKLLVVIACLRFYKSWSGRKRMHVAGRFLVGLLQHMITRMGSFVEKSVIAGLHCISFFGCRQFCVVGFGKNFRCCWSLRTTDPMRRPTISARFKAGGASTQTVFSTAFPIMN